MPDLLAANATTETMTVDATTVGSIGQVGTADTLVPADTLALPDAVELPPALDASTETTDPAVTTPVSLDMPPEQVGPEAMRQAAMNGDARAQFEVAAIYSEGRAVPEDLAAAAAWYERAAVQGFAPAEYRLGSFYEGGKGVAQDYEQARLWYTRAAEAGNRMSMHNLAALYAGGQLGTQQFDLAAQWFEQAANRGLTDSQFNLGMLYARGLGVDQDFERSFKWFAIAAINGDEGAATARDDVARNLDADTMTRLTQDVATWRPASFDLAANFAPIGTWSDTFDPGAQITDRDLVGKVQIVLNRLGYDVGTPDGLAGPKTEDAIKAFETATGMNPLGQINPRLLAVLGSQPV
jgi:localization factor PodJL